MKRMFNKKNLSLILIFLLFVNVSAVVGKNLILMPINTGITNLSWSKNDTIEFNENYTYFDFVIDYEISNPNKNPVTFRSPSSLAFLPNISIIFENNTLNISPLIILGQV